VGQITRRGFLLGLGAAIVAPEIVRAYFLPPNGGWPRFSTNSYLTSKYAWYLKTDPLPFGLAPIKREGAAIEYDDGIALTSAAHPGSEAVTKEEVDFIEAGGWTCAKGHPYCNCCPGPDLTEASLEQLCIDIQKVCGDRDVILRKPRLFVGTRRFP
jgi:hypothetical protein